MINLKKQRGFIQFPLFSFLSLAMRPLLVQFMAMVGIGLLTFTGVTTGINTLITNARGAYTGLPNAVLGLAGLAGLGEGFGIITAAILVRVAVSFMPRFGRLPQS